MLLSVFTRSGAVSTSVPSRSKTTIGATIPASLTSKAPKRQGEGMDVEAQKRAAAARALDFVHSGMRIGLGTGSTAKHLVDLLAARVRDGLQVIAVPTSEATREQAQRLAIP